MANLELARLVGAYHARRGWGDAAEEERWRRSLSGPDRTVLLEYQLRGAEIFDENPIRLGLHIVASPSISDAIRAASKFGDVMIDLADRIQRSLAPVGEQFFVMAADVAAVVERIQRDRLYSRLRSANALGLRMPDRLARWVADRYPLDWTLDNPRLRDFLDGVLRRGHHEA